MYNKKVLIESLKKLGNAKAPTQKKDVVVGLNNPIQMSSMKQGGSLVDKQLSVKKSNIQGNGLFINEPIRKGDIIGLAHINNQATPIVGKNHNHSENNPTAVNISQGNKRYLVAAKDLPAGTEITTNYRLQPELEQPEDFMRNGGMTPQKDGYRTYSPYKNLPYIDIDTDTIDTDNIVYDLQLVANNGVTKNVQKNTGLHKIPGASVIREIPIDSEKQSFKKGGGPGDRWLASLVKQATRSNYNPIVYPVKLAGERIARLNSMASRSKQDIIDSLFKKDYEAKYFGDSGGNDGSNSMYGFGKRDLIANYFRGIDTGFEPTDYDFDSDAGLEALINEYGPLKAYLMNSEVQHEEPLSARDLMYHRFNKSMPHSGYEDPNMLINDPNISDNWNYSFHNYDADKTKENFHKLFDLYGKEIIPFDIQPNTSKKPPLFSFDYSPVNPIDNVAGHMAFLQRTPKNEFQLTTRDSWGFFPPSYDSKWNMSDKLKQRQTQLMDAFGKPFILTQNNPITFKKGGVHKTKNKNSRSYSRSLDATNKFFAENYLFEKPSSRKNKIYDPHAKYYQDGGYIVEELPEAQDGGPQNTAGPRNKVEPEAIPVGDPWSPDYDLRRFTAEDPMGFEAFSHGKGHATDQYKLPNHPTFSDHTNWADGSVSHGSLYSNTENPGGEWVQKQDGSWNFNTSHANRSNMSDEDLKWYFENVEPGNTLNNNPVKKQGGFVQHELVKAQTGLATTSDSLSLYNNAIKLKGFYDNLKPYYNNPEIDPWYDRSLTNIQKETLMHPNVSSSNKTIIKNNKNANVIYMSDIITEAIDPKAPLLKYDTRIKPQGEITYRPKTYAYAENVSPDIAKIQKMTNSNAPSYSGSWTLNSVQYGLENDPIKKANYKKKLINIGVALKLKDPEKSINEWIYRMKKDKEVHEKLPGYITTLPYYDPLAIKPANMLSDNEIKIRFKKYGASGIPQSKLKALGLSSSIQSVKLIDKKPVQSVKPKPADKKILDKNGYTPTADYLKKYPPIYISNPKDARIGLYSEAGNIYVYKPKPAVKVNTPKPKKPVIHNIYQEPVEEITPLKRMSFPQVARPEQEIIPAAPYKKPVHYAGPRHGTWSDGSTGQFPQGLNTSDWERKTLEYQQQQRGTKPIVTRKEGGTLDKAQEGGEQTVTDTDKDYYTRMANSPLFVERYARMVGKPIDQVGEEAEAYRQQILNNIETVKINDVGVYPDKVTKRKQSKSIEGVYYPPVEIEKEEIDEIQKNINEAPEFRRKHLQKNFDETVAKLTAPNHNLFLYADDPWARTHELSHASVKGNINDKNVNAYSFQDLSEYPALDKYYNSGKKYLKYFDGRKEYLISPDEQKARVDVARKYLESKGLYDPVNENFTPQHYRNYLMELEKSNNDVPHDIDEITTPYDVETTIKMFNDFVEKEPTQNSNLVKAEQGGEMDYELGDTVDKATMERLKKLGYTFETI